MQINLQHVFKMSASRTRIHASERLLRTRPTFSETVIVSVGVSKLGCTELFICRAGVKINDVYYRDMLLMHKLLPVTLGRYQRMSSCFSRTVLQHTVLVRHWALTSRDTPDFISPEQWPPNSPVIQILTRWITKSGLQCSSASTRQRFEMLTNCDSVC